MVSCVQLQLTVGITFKYSIDDLCSFRVFVKLNCFEHANEFDLCKLFEYLQ